MSKIRDLLTEESIAELIHRETYKHTDKVPTSDGKWQIKEYADDFFEKNKEIIKEINDRYSAFIWGKMIKTNWSLLQYLKRRACEIGFILVFPITLYFGLENYTEGEYSIAIMMAIATSIIPIMIYMVRSERKNDEKERR